MKWNRSVWMSWGLLALAAGTLSGCGELGWTKPAPAQPAPWWDDKPKEPARARSDPAPPPAEDHAGGGLLGLFGPAKTSGAAKEGNCTILLSVCRGPGSHVKQAKHYKKATEQHARWKNLFIVHKEDHSLLYWGRYEKVPDAHPNLKKAKAYRTPTGMPVFAKAIIVPIPGLENAGPPEWNLANVPAQYAFTVLIAEFRNVPEANYMGRQTFAVDYCRLLRKENVPAYYKHDSVSSIVTVGAFDPSAVSLVRQGKTLRHVPRDPKINAIFKRFPDLAVNGRQKLIKAVNAKTRKVHKIPAPTHLIQIPRDHASPWAGGKPLETAGPVRITAQLKVVHVPDGEVFATATGSGTSDDITRLARRLVHQFAKRPSAKGKRLAVARFRNRLSTPGGAAACEELAFKTMGILLAEGHFTVKQRVGLRKVVPEKSLDDPAIVTAPQVRRKLDGLDYVVLGSVAALTSDKSRIPPVGPRTSRDP